jgi:L-ribulose-5-phosphate 4-epimerase
MDYHAGKTDDGQRPSSVIDPDLLNAVIRLGRNLSIRGLMPGSQGNISVRDPATQRMVITPHDLPYDDMAIDDLVVLDVASGDVVAGSRTPSFELDSHVTVFRQRGDVNAVVHTEPTFVNVLGALGREIPAVTATGLKSAGGTIPVMPFAYSRDVDFARDMLRIMADRHAVVWGNHGLVVVGSSLHEASERTFGVEENARVLVIASLMGEPHTLEFVTDVGMVVA